MSLKTDRYEEETDISFFYNTGTATRGGVACMDTTTVNASGAALDQGVNRAAYVAAVPTSVPVGILLNDVVNKDLTRTHLNFYKDEVQKGGKVTLLRRGWVVSNNITGSVAPGDLAFADSGVAGNMCNGTSLFGVSFLSSGYQQGTKGSGNFLIGRFMSNKDADGYAKVWINIV
jgi:hypothetical protein